MLRNQSRCAVLENHGPHTFVDNDDRESDESACPFVRAKHCPRGLGAKFFSIAIPELCIQLTELLQPTLCSEISWPTEKTKYVACDWETTGASTPCTTKCQPYYVAATCPRARNSEACAFYDGVQLSRALSRLEKLANLKECSIWSRMLFCQSLCFMLWILYKLCSRVCKE